MADVVRIFGLLLGYIGGLVAAVVGYIVTIQLLVGTSWFPNGETKKAELSVSTSADFERHYIQASARSTQPGRSTVGSSVRTRSYPTR